MQSVNDTENIESITETTISEQNTSTEKAGNTKTNKPLHNKTLLGLLILVVACFLSYQVPKTIKSLIITGNEQRLSTSLLWTLHKIDTAQERQHLSLYTSNESDFSNEKDYIYETLDKLPDTLKQGFTSKGWKIGFIGTTSNNQKKLLDNLVDSSEDDLVRKLGDFRGLTVPSTKTILIRLSMGDRVYNNETVKKTIFHEFGHYIMLELMTEQEKQDWEELYNPLRNTEKWVFLNAEEGFSEMFANAMANEVLTYPDSEFHQYEFISNIIEEYLKSE
jgi:hypothetical protein